MQIEYIKIRDSRNLPIQINRSYQIKNKADQSIVVKNAYVLSFNGITNLVYFVDMDKNSNFTMINDPNINFTFKLIVSKGGKRHKTRKTKKRLKKKIIYFV
jgi:hypothetical protein